MRTTPGVVVSVLAVSLAGLMWLTWQPLSLALALGSGDYYLRLLSTAVLSPTSPTATTAQFKDSPAVNRTTYQEREAHSLAASPPTPEERLVVSQHGSDQL